MPARVRDFFTGFAQTLDLPEELILNLPVFFLLGGQKLYMENHRGLIEYSTNKVRIRVQNGHITLEGTGLIIDEIHESFLWISGSFLCIQFRESGGDDGLA